MRNYRSEIAAFVSRYLRRRGWPERLRWDPCLRSDGVSASCLTLSDRLPGPAFRRGTGLKFSVTSDHHRLNTSRFGRPAEVINRHGRKGHGRTLSCLERGGDPISAIAFHRPHEQSAPLLITGIAVIESDSDPAQATLSRVMAGILLVYLAAGADKAGHPTRLGLGGGRPDDLASDLGFRKTAAPSVYRQSGAGYREWVPPRGLSRARRAPNR